MHVWTIERIPRIIDANCRADFWLVGLVIGVILSYPWTCDKGNAPADSSRKIQCWIVYKQVPVIESLFISHQQLPSRSSSGSATQITMLLASSYLLDCSGDPDASSKLSGSDFDNGSSSKPTVVNSGAGAGSKSRLILERIKSIFLGGSSSSSD